MKIKGGAGATRKKPPSARGLGIPLIVVLEQVSTLLIKDLPLLLYSIDQDRALLLNVHGKSHTHARSVQVGDIFRKVIGFSPWFW